MESDAQHAAGKDRCIVTGHRDRQRSGERQDKTSMVQTSLASRAGQAGQGRATRYGRHGTNVTQAYVWTCEAYNAASG